MPGPEGGGPGEGGAVPELPARMSPVATEDRMNRSRFPLLLVVFASVVPCLAAEPAAPQEVGLVTLNPQEVAKGYRANTLKLKSVVNEKGETIGNIDDFIFGKDGSIFVVLAVGDFVGLGSHLVAVPFRSLKLDDPRGDIVVPGASRAALQKLPVFFNNR
jgi:sporulation protein YlmC with PRC-barrel domain